MLWCRSKGPPAYRLNVSFPPPTVSSPPLALIPSRPNAHSIRPFADSHFRELPVLIFANKQDTANKGTAIGWRSRHSLVRQLAVQRAQIDVEHFGGLFLVAVRRREDVFDVLALALLQEALERRVGR